MLLSGEVERTRASSVHPSGCLTENVLKGSRDGWEQRGQFAGCPDAGERRRCPGLGAGQWRYKGWWDFICT